MLNLLVSWLHFSHVLHVQDPVVRPLVEQDTKTLQRLLPEIPPWVKNPDHDRVCYSSFSLNSYYD